MFLWYFIENTPYAVLFIHRTHLFDNWKFVPLDPPPTITPAGSLTLFSVFCSRLASSGEETRQAPLALFTVVALSLLPCHSRPGGSITH